MNAAIDVGGPTRAIRRSPARAARAVHARIALLGTGTVGHAVLERLASWSETARGETLQLAHVANSRIAIADSIDVGSLCPRSAAAVFSAAPITAPRLTGVAPNPVSSAPMASSLDAVTASLGACGTRIVIDATASERVAGRHATWLAQGIHVVTACKLGQGTSLARWRAIREAARRTGTLYGDSATVGAGLPLLRCVRELQEGGDRIHAIAGVLSGSLAWLFHHYDGMRPFSSLVRQARAAGYTEPDPRDDLSGEDVRRKLLILARAAGCELEPHQVEVESLVPAELALLSSDAVDAALSALDAPLRRRFGTAYRRGEKLRFIARLECIGQEIRTRVGLESLPADDPLATGAGTDNKVAIWSDRYRTQPLVIQGPGAGAEVTAAGLLDDALRIARGG